MLAPRISGRAAVPDSVPNLSLRTLFGKAREPDRQAEDAPGDSLVLAPEAEGKPGLTHPPGASPRARPGPRMWGAGTGAAPERPEPRPGSRVQRGQVPRCAITGRLRAAAPQTRLRPRLLSPRLPAAPPPPAPSLARLARSISFQNQLPNWRAGVGRSRLCFWPPLSQADLKFEMQLRMALNTCISGVGFPSPEIIKL
ncbi:ubiquitin carboxyl-terminal hydrolase 21-like [Microtus oregoni]|uniref:ubiquitin carboxyl-terminal hydrolase 21-like n=1 Tax=Microtus oregoni TaxID=111838 RepID=UPI001BB1B980|nr:ubiquitin carboxyl-terminal hydrolase 21-like [Microtus oregoni]